MDLRTLLLAGAGVLVAAAMAARAFSAPLRLAGRAAVNTLLGLGALLLLNVLSPLTGLSLGVPGLVLLLLVQWVLT